MVVQGHRGKFHVVESLRGWWGEHIFNQELILDTCVIQIFLSCKNVLVKTKESNMSSMKNHSLYYIFCIILYESYFKYSLQEEEIKPKAKKRKKAITVDDDSD